MAMVIITLVTRVGITGSSGEKGRKRIWWPTVEHDAETNEEGMQEGKLLDKYFSKEQKR